MVDKIKESVDIVVQLFDDDDDDFTDDNANDHSVCSFDATSSHSNQPKETGKEISIVRMPEHRLNARPLYAIQRKDITIIRQLLKEQNRLLLKAYKSNAMYSCSINEFDEKISTFMTQTNAYSLIEELNEVNPNCVKKMLDTIVKQVKTTLDDLLQNQSITAIQYEEMKISRDRVHLDYLFFLPDTRHDDIPVVPIMICCESPVINICRLVNRLLEPIYTRVALKNTFFEGADAVQALRACTGKGHLRSTTVFARLHVNHILTTFPHEQATQVVERFLGDHVPTKEIQGMSLATVIQLIRVVLANQWFVYDYKLYQQVRGGGSGLPLLTLLVNIILFDWQTEFVQYLQDKNEVFGRHFDEIFLTWNGSREKLDSFIHRMNSKNSSIQVQSTIGTQIDYLEAHIRLFCVDDDHEMELETQVNHESKVEPYALPYVYDHPPDQYSTLIRAAMIRAARCCSDIYEFQQERHYIELSFTINNFPIGFINEHITVFFLEFNMEEFDHTMYDRETYEELRENVIKYEQRCLQRKMERQEQAHEYNLQYVSLSTKRPGFTQIKRYSHRHRNHSHGNHSKLYFEIVGRPNYPANTK